MTTRGRGPSATNVIHKRVRYTKTLEGFVDDYTHGGQRARLRKRTLSRPYRGRQNGRHDLVQPLRLKRYPWSISRRTYGYSNSLLFCYT